VPKKDIGAYGITQIILSSSLHNNIYKLTDHLFRYEAGKMVAVLTRLFGLHNLELAEDVVQEAFGRALKEWIYKVPENPSGWLMQVAKNLAIDTVRRQRHHREFAADTTVLLKSEYTVTPVIENFFLDHEIQDSQLRMMFACCHPALSEADRIALTLKTCSGFGIKEIAVALLLKEDVIKKRLQRAKKLIIESTIRFDIPVADQLKQRLDSVLHIIYLIFNEGYHSSSKEELIRKDLCEEAIRLSLLLTENRFTNYPKSYALVSLLSLMASRFAARLDEAGEIVLLEDQDRTTWNHELIAIGLRYLEKSIGGEELSEYHIEAAIVSEHSIATSFLTTDWHRILYLYDLLMQINTSPVILLNRAVVISKVLGHQKAIEAIKSIPEIDDLIESHYLFPAILGEMYRQLQNREEATHFFEIALRLTPSRIEKKLLQKRLDDVT
jgi:RNA polymerase sigma factor (sigma-70 family)